MIERELPVLAIVDTLVLGGTTAGAVRALLCAKEGKRVLLAEEKTYLCTDAFAFGCVTVGEGGEGTAAGLFPPEVWHGAALHPDRVKKNAERLMEEHGVRFLYACQAVHIVQTQAGLSVVFAHKAGLYAVLCGELYDLRLDAPEHGAGGYFLQTELMGCANSLPGTETILTDTLARGSLTVESGTRIRFEAGAGGDGHSVAIVPVDLLEKMPPAEERLAVSLLSLDIAAYMRKSFGGNIRPARSVRTLYKEAFSTVEAVRKAEDAVPKVSNMAVRKAEKLTVSLLVTILPERDVLVVGGGTAGAPAGIAAAQSGATVTVLEMNSDLGGTATCGGVSTYWFGTRGGATALIDREVESLYETLGIQREKVLWNRDDAFLPDCKAAALLDMSLHAGTGVLFGCIVCGAPESGEMLFARDGALFSVKAKVTADMTGDGDAAVFCGADFTYGDRDTGVTFWASLAQYTSPDDYKNNFSAMVRADDPWDYTRFIAAARKLGGELYDHGAYVAMRESRHVRGLCEIRLDELLSLKKTDEELCRCFSNYDPKGKLTADCVYAGLLPPNLFVGIPRGALVPVRPDGTVIPGLLVGGKAFSCTHNGIPGLRMQPDLQQQGWAIGLWAAMAAARGVTPMEIPYSELQPVLHEAGLLEGYLPERDDSDGQYAEALNGKDRLEWLDQEVYTYSGQETAAACFTAEPEEIVPILLRRYREAYEGPDKRMLARLLLWHGCPEGAVTVAQEIEDRLKAAGEELPLRTGIIGYGQLLPDHGLMPETVYLLNLFAHADPSPVLGCFEEILRRLLEGMRDWYEGKRGVYCYIECFAYVACGTGDRRFLPMLRRLTALPELMDPEALGIDPMLTERFAMLRVTLRDAMARLGDEESTMVLREIVKSDRRAVAEMARLALRRLEDGGVGKPEKRRIY